MLGGTTLGTNFLSVNVAWGIAVTMGVYVSAGVSGKSLPFYYHVDDNASPVS